MILTSLHATIFYLVVVGTTGVSHKIVSKLLIENFFLAAQSEQVFSRAGLVFSFVVSQHHRALLWVLCRCCRVDGDRKLRFSHFVFFDGKVQR
jgi:hypothetical protein